LRRAEPCHEIAAADAPRIVHCLEHLIDGREPTGDRFRRNGFASDDTVSCEELLCHRRGPLCRGPSITGGNLTRRLDQ
jgi:hypothetical protein